MARENQGLQIALIILFMLTIILGVTTYIFCRQYIEADERASKLEGDLSSTTQANQTIQGESNELKKMILGTEDAEEKELEEITTLFNEDKEKFSAGFDNVDKFYRPLLIHLHDQLNKKNVALTDATDALQTLQDDYDKWKGQMTAQVKTHEDARLAAEKKLNDATAEYTAQLAQIRTGKDEIQKDLDTARKETETRVAAMGTERDNALVQAKNLQIHAEKLRDQLEEERPGTPEVPDGEVSWVDQRAGTVWINLGRAHALREQTTFSVYPVDMTNLAKAHKKAGIEVTRILGAELAEAKIVEDVTADPIMTGDKIHTPAWSPGEQVGFVLVGLMDMDGDGASDMQAVRDLIRISGGRVDYWRDDKGNKDGEITINTRYLVVDSESLEVKAEAEEAKAKAADTRASAYSEEMKIARQFGLKKITLGDLLKQMGWKSQTRVVRYGQDANPRDFRPKPPEETRPGSGGNQFQPRRPLPGQLSPRGGAY